MSLRTRILLAFAAVVLIPIALLALGIRLDITRRLSNEYQVRVDSIVAVIGEDLGLESAGIGERLGSLKNALLNDQRFRFAVAGLETEQTYLANYAANAMRLTGLSVLHIQDSEGRMISSGSDRDLLALGRRDSFMVGDQTFTLIGGIAVDPAFLARLARDRAIVVSLRYPSGEMSSGKPDETADAAVGELGVPLIHSHAGRSIEDVQARLRVTQSKAPLQALLRSADSWFLATAAGTGITALVLAVWVSSRISRPLADLAEKTAVLDLDRLDVEFDEGADEVGRLSRLLGELTSRLRSSTARVREAERRATVGDLARQVNHDIKNGLIPLRNVMRHLSEVQRDDPAALARRLRRAASDGRFQPRVSRDAGDELPAVVAAGQSARCDLNALITDVVRGRQGHERVDVEADLADLPEVVGDPIAFRRILENLMANAVDSLESKPGRITVSTRVVERDGERRYPR